MMCERFHSNKKVFPLPKIRPCHVVLNNIQGLLDEDGVYIVPGRSRRNLTCYRCFRKFNSAESLEVHKAEHEPESEEENVYAVSDSEMEIESESEEETNELVEVSSKIQQKTPNDKVVEKSPAQKVAEPVQNVPKPPETALQKQVQVVEPIRSKVEVIPKPQPVHQEKKSEETKKVPVLCNIQIRCLTCDVLFTNSELLMKHQPVNAENQCCFTCKVCTESYSQPEDYLNHIMQHNTFSSSRYGYRGGPRKKPEFRCTYCRLEFDHRFQLQQHESSHHKTPEPIAVAPAKIQVAPAKIQVVPVSDPPSLVPVVVLNDTKKPVEEKPAAAPTVDLSTSPTEEQEAPKPKIWVIKEAMMKSPEPAVEPRAAITSTGLSAVKRNIDQIQSHEELLKPAKRGRPSKTGSVTPPVILNPTVPAVGIEVTTSLTCDVCFDVFQNRAAFEEHMVFHGVKKTVVEPVPAKSNHVGTPEAAHECPTCKLHFKSHAGLRRHQTCAHENRKITSFVCDKCSKIFSSRKGLNIHKSSCLGNTVEDRQ
ncbi:zinc finger protein 628-like isoform X15 [Coccinella septempunctata]|uniref:zinc finger protein 628-like isoform X15 n=1 Tax=Coccinella septempunctata TaxID=41139 RepID=UPI001D07EE71|nr:zinc finger protein 628-like isoform X15 [Coccinella septempunctata]